VVIGVVPLYRSSLAGCLLNATAFLIVSFYCLVALIEIYTTSSSILAHMLSPLVTSSVHFLLSSTKDYLVTVCTTADLLLSLPYLNVHLSPPLVHSTPLLPHCLHHAPLLALHYCCSIPQYSLGYLLHYLLPYLQTDLSSTHRFPTTVKRSQSYT